MKSITKLKDEARKHEQKEEWEKAITAYLQVLGMGDDDGEVELPLFNRVGDLYVRLARPRDAVHYYEQAAERYAEAGLYNNAIALCNKALRYMPGHMELLRKLGQFSAQQGFLTDARRYYLEYAEKKIAGGETDAALKALSSFANVAEDAEVREMLGRRLHVHGRTTDAVLELRRAYDMRIQAGEHAAAETLRAEILAIDPGAFPLDLADAAPAGGRETGPVTDDLPTAPPELEEDTGLERPPEALEEYRIDLPGLDSPSVEEPAAAIDAAPLEGLESGVFEGFGESEGGELLPGLEAATEFEPPAETGGFQLEGLERPVLEPPTDVPHLETTSYEESVGEREAEEDVPFDLPTLDGDYEGEEASTSFDLPMLDADHEPEAASGSFDLPLLDPDGEPREETEPHDDVSTFEPLPTLEDVQAEIAAEPEPEPLPELPELPGHQLAEPELPEPELPPLPAPGDLADEAEEPAEDEPAARQEVVDAAAQGQAEAGPAESAWDPAELGPPVQSVRPAPAEPTPAAPRPSKAPPRDDFVDLGSLLTEDDEEKVEDTRFVVQEKPPTGDEDQDFAELLSQFKQKVAEHVSAEDAAAHYDLGLAFKEMGLVDEAIGEFQVALRAGDMRLKVYEELGQCFLLKEQYNIAEKVLRRALELKYQDELELLGVYYHLGRAYEALNQREQARDAYERVLGIDINFGDVNARLARL